MRWDPSMSRPIVCVSDAFTMAAHVSVFAMNGIGAEELREFMIGLAKRGAACSFSVSVLTLDSRKRMCCCSETIPLEQIIPALLMKKANGVAKTS